SLRAPEVGSTGAALSPEGRWLAAAGHIKWDCSDAGLRLYDLTTGKEAAALPGAGSVVGLLAFSPDGRRLVSGSADGGAFVWDVAACVGPLPKAAWAKDEADRLWNDLAADAARAWRATGRLAADPGAAAALL